MSLGAMILLLKEREESNEVIGGEKNEPPACKYYCSYI